MPPQTLPMTVTADAFLFFMARYLAERARPVDVVRETMERYAAARIEEYLEAQRRVTVPDGAAVDDAGV
jgi:hypothetical protein